MARLLREGGAAVSRTRPLPEATPELRSHYWARVDRSDLDGCWPWIGTRNAGGRGVVHVLGGRWYAYRVSYALNIGPVPNGMLVCHKCDNPICVRPSHLFLGTTADNMADCSAKGRVVVPEHSGMECYQTRWTPELLDEVKERYLTGYWSLAALARRYDVNPSTVGRWLDLLGVERLPLRPQPCSMADCEAPARSRRMCRKHYLRTIRAERRTVTA